LWVTVTVGASAFAAALARRVSCRCTGVGGVFGVGRGSFDFSLREPSSAFLICSRSCSSFAMRLACSTTKSLSMQS
jgi:hypothetical protein